jgi:hypothetical protein
MVGLVLEEDRLTGNTHSLDMWGVGTSLSGNLPAGQKQQFLEALDTG